MRPFGRSNHPEELCRRNLLVASVMSTLFCLLIRGGVATKDSSFSLHEAASNAMDAVSRHSGWSLGDMRLGRVNLDDAKVGQSLTYNFVLDVGGVRTEFALAEEVKTWEYLIPQEALLPPVEIDQAAAETGKGELKEAGVGESRENKGLEVWQPKVMRAKLPAFDLAGPLELWIQDAGQLRLAMPHDVDAGEVKKVVLADGATVTVHGAQSLSLARPIQLPLPLKTNLRGAGPTEGTAAAGLMALAEHLRAFANAQEHSGRPTLALRLVKPSALVAATHPLPPASRGQGEGVTGEGNREAKSYASGLTEPEGSKPANAESTESTAVNRLKVRRLSSGAVELRSRSVKGTGLQKWEDGPLTWAWPLPQVNQSDARLLALEQALLGILGKKASKKGSFQVIGAAVTPVSLIRLQFEVDILKPEDVEMATIPGGTNVTSVEGRNVIQKSQWEVSIRAGPEGVLQPLNLKQLSPVAPTVTLSYSDRTLNGTFAMQD